MDDRLADKRTKLLPGIPVNNGQYFLKKVVGQGFAVDLGNVHKEMAISNHSISCAHSLRFY